MQKLKQIGVLFVAGALTACGGGDDGGGSTSTSTSTSDLYNGSTEEVTVTSDNANTVAASVVDMDLGGASSGLDYVGTLSVSTDAGKPTLKGLSSELIRKALNHSSGSSSGKYSIAQAQSTVSCYDADGNASGSYSYSITKADPNTTTSGDKVSMTYNNCSFYSIYGYSTTNGTINVTFNQASGDVDGKSSDYSLSTTISYESFKLIYSYNGSSSEFLIDGGATMSDSKSSGVESGSMTGSSLYMKDVYNSVTDEMLLSNFDISYTDDGLILAEDANYTIATTDIGGSITVETTQPIKLEVYYYGGERYYLYDYPYEGQVVITGANGSKVRITAYDATYTYVQVEVDADGDGTYEFNDPNVLWSELA